MKRRRRAFGLDAPRPPSLPRTEAAILAWLAAHMPRLACLRVASESSQNDNRTASTLALVLPEGRAAILRIDVAPDRPGAETLALARDCARRRIPIDIVADLDGARAALRRLGVEPDEIRSW